MGTMEVLFQGMGTRQTRRVQVQNIVGSGSLPLVYVQNKQAATTLETPSAVEILLRGIRVGFKTPLCRKRCVRAVRAEFTHEEVRNYVDRVKWSGCS